MKSLKNKKYYQLAEDLKYKIKLLELVDKGIISLKYWKKLDVHDFHIWVESKDIQKECVYLLQHVKIIEDYTYKLPNGLIIYTKKKYTRVPEELQNQNIINIV